MMVYYYISCAKQATIFLKKASLYSVDFKKNESILTEDQLVRGCVLKNEAAQKAVFDLYAGKMLGVCMRYARNNADAEDMLQDAFIKVFDKIKQFKGEGSFEGWIRKIVVNTALKKYTLIRYDKEIIGHEGVDAEHFFSTEQVAYSHLSEKELLQLINKLPDGYRFVFNMYVIEGYSHDEIATLLGIQSGTSRSQLAKARMLLQKQILQIQKQAV
jgi:RNA polymerase sigma factor (sigma-70 family)